MASLRFAWPRALLVNLCCFGSAFGQTAYSTSQADGLSTAAGSATATVATETISGSQTTYSVAFTVPAAADIGANVLPNIMDPTAVNAQDVCPGYTASGVERTTNGFSATLELAGKAVSS